MPIDRSITRRVRVIRAAIVSGLAVLVAAISHMAAGGNTPTLLALISSTIVVMPLVMLLTSATFSVWRTFVSVALTQALFHWMFVSIGISNPVSATGEPLPAHAEHFGMVQEFVPFMPEGSGAGLAMWLSHLVAAALTVMMLRRAESALDTVQTALARLLFGGSRPTPVFPALAPKTRPLHNTEITRHQLELWPSISHRGPPCTRDAIHSRHSHTPAFH